MRNFSTVQCRQCPVFQWEFKQLNVIRLFVIFMNEFLPIIGIGGIVAEKVNE